MIEPKKSGIYLIANEVDGKCYIGSAVCIKRRWAEHIRQLSGNRHHSIKLQNAWNKYGRTAFTFSVLEYVEDKHDLLRREQFWIDKFSSHDLGYNICQTAGNCLGVKHSAETRAKVSAAMKLVVISPETREKMRLGKIGKKLSPETRAKISAGQIGRTPSEETRAKLRASSTGRVYSEATRAKISAGSKGRVYSDEVRERMSAAKKGVRHSEETKQKMRIAALGKIRSPETRARMSLAKRNMSVETRIKMSETHKLRRAESA